jgi:glycosyltransferase involved in cell wall biosynthesis
MFESALIDPIKYSDPWNLTFEERFAAFNGASKTIAYFYEKPDTSTFRYRIFNMVQALADEPSGAVRASWFHRGDIQRMDEVIDRVDALVFCRTRYTPAMGRLVMRAKNRGIRVVYDVDDLVFNTDYTELVLGTLDQEVDLEAVLNDWFAYFSRQGALLRLCDHVITTNEYLSNQAKIFAPHISTGIVPNFLNRQQQRISTQLFERKRADRFRSSAPHQIGYFSGTPTHRRDFAVISQALSRLLDEDSDLQLVIVGYLEPGQDLDKHADRIDRYPLQDYLNLQRIIAQTEINVAPLVDNTFTNCKSELKFFEAAITGTITIATPTFTFRRAIVDGQNGFLAKSHEWEAKLRRAVDLIRDRDRYAEMAVEGFNFAERTYGWNRHAATITRAIFEGGPESVASVGSTHPATLPESGVVPIGAL